MYGHKKIRKIAGINTDSWIMRLMNQLNKSTYQTLLALQNKEKIIKILTIYDLPWFLFPSDT